MHKADETARDAMRDATADAHNRVELALGLGSPEVSWSQYQRALMALSQTYGAVAAWLPGTRLAEAAHGASARLGVHLARLQADLAYAESRAVVGAWQALRAQTLPVAPPPADWGEMHGFGMLYVIEGSTLGGQYVARHLSARLGLDPTHGLTFFHGDGPETGARWRAFRADLAQHVATDATRAQAIAGAHWTFDALLQAWECLG